jgi:hypothetical protein
MSAISYTGFIPGTKELWKDGKFLSFIGGISIAPTKDGGYGLLHWAGCCEAQENFKPEEHGVLEVRLALLKEDKSDTVEEIILTGVHIEDPNEHEKQAMMRRYTYETMTKITYPSDTEGWWTEELQ